MGVMPAALHFLTASRKPSQEVIVFGSTPAFSQSSRLYQKTIGLMSLGSPYVFPLTVKFWTPAG